MNPKQPRPLPNAADKAALKVLAAHVVKACPSLHDAAHEVAAHLLVQHGLSHLDPDQVYFHRFKSAQSLESSFTGWQHYGEKPYESLTLTQLVIHRFRATDQDNADLLDLYGGFYTAGPEAENFDASNEVQLRGKDVLKAFWDIDFSQLYRHQLHAFWDAWAGDFRTLAKCTFLGKAIEARDNGQLSDDDWQTALDAVIGPLTWPITLKLLQTDAEPGPHLRVAALDIAGHAASNILRIIDAKGRQILYVPGESQAFHVFETPSDLHGWILTQMNDEALRRAFMSHFPLSERQAIDDHLADLMNRLVNTWGHADHQLINQKDQAIAGDAFGWLRDSTRRAMTHEADLALTSNGDLRKKLWIGYLSAGLKVFGPMAAVGWPVALPVIGAGVASMGLNIDQAVNGKTAAERKDGVIGAIFNAIDVLFNLPFLKGVGPMAEVGAEVEAAEAAEWDEYSEALRPPEEPAPPSKPEVQTEGALPTPGEIPRAPAEPVRPRDIPQKFQTNELLDGKTPISEPGKYQGIYTLDGDPPHAILIDDSAYYVRYFPDARGGGYWAIVDPARPNQFIHSLPVHLNAEGQWERMPRLRLPAGGQCFGKGCVLELDSSLEGSQTENSLDTLPSRTEETELSDASAPRLVTTAYDVDRHALPGLKRWALGIPETHVRVQIGPGGRLVVPDRYAPNFAEKARALLLSSRRFYANLQWQSLPVRPTIPTLEPSTSFSALVERVFSEAPGLVIGEPLDRLTSMRLVIENMPSMAAQGLKTIYMRRLLADFAQADLNDYFTSGVMSEDLLSYLRRLGTDPTGRFNQLELVKTAQANGVRVQALDCAANYRRPAPQTAVDEQMMANHLTNEIMFTDKILNGHGKWLILTGPESTNTFRGLAGLAELEGGIGVRIEDVNPGQGQRLEIDPGIDVDRGPFFTDDNTRGTADTLQADLRLQVEAPQLTRTDEYLQRLLYRKGMYLFEKAGDAYTLVHRGTSGSLVRTAVEPMADGNVCINRPAWPQVSGKPFASIDQLSHALNGMGLVLQNRIPV